MAEESQQERKTTKDNANQYCAQQQKQGAALNLQEVSAKNRIFHLPRITKRCVRWNYFLCQCDCVCSVARWIRIERKLEIHIKIGISLQSSPNSKGDAKSSILCAPIKMLRFPWNRLLLLLLLLSLLLLILLLYKRVLERRVLLCTVEPGPFVKFLISAEWVVARKMLIANCCARDLSPSCRVSILHGCRSVALKTCQIEAGGGGGKVVDRHRYTGRERERDEGK